MADIPPGESFDEDDFRLDASSGHITNIYVPARMKGVAIALAEVHCGWSHTLAVTG